MTAPYWPKGLESTQVVNFKCSEEALPEIINLLETLNRLGTEGHTRDFMIGDDQFCFDGNGKHRLHEITVNGEPLSDWRLKQEQDDSHE